MKQNWEVKKLGEVCEVIAGQSPEGKYHNKIGEGLPFYQGKKEFTSKFLGEPTTWTTNITKEAFHPNINQITSDYLFEILRSDIIKKQIKKHVSGAAQPQLPIKTLVN